MCGKTEHVGNLNFGSVAHLYIQSCKIDYTSDYSLYSHLCTCTSQLMIITACVITLVVYTLHNMSKNFFSFMYYCSELLFCIFCMKYCLVIFFIDCQRLELAHTLDMHVYAVFSVVSITVDAAGGFISSYTVSPFILLS